MSEADPKRFHGRCTALFIGARTLSRRELAPLVSRHFPLCSFTELPPQPTPQQLSAAFRTPGPRLCFVEIERETSPGLDLIPQLLAADPKLGIVAILPAKHPDLILRALRRGATDFFVPPFTEDQFESAARKLIKVLPKPEASAQPAKIYCVMPAKGACGASTVACSLAFQWKRLGAARVLLTDLDPITGTVPFLLKVKSMFSFVDVLQRASDIDADLWKAMVVQCQGIDVLLSPESADGGTQDFLDASPILDFARFSYDVVVNDAGGVYGEWNISQAQLADEVILVMTNELSSVYSAQRAISYLENNGIGHWKIRLVVNRYDEQVGLHRDAIQSALHADVYQTLPSDYEAVQKSLLEGKPIASSCKLGKSISSLSEKLAGREEVAKKTSSLAGLLSLFSRTSG